MNDQVQLNETDRNWNLKRRPRVDQIDLAPSLALLLGFPIPFGSLGKVIPELFFTGDDWLSRYRSLNEALFVNAVQVLEYLREYRVKAGVGLDEALLKEFFNTVQNAYQNLDAIERDSNSNDAAKLEQHKKVFR